jgi:hypothetical protein
MLVAPMNTTAFGSHFHNFAPADFDTVARSFALAEGGPPLGCGRSEPGSAAWSREE